jgi:hypothetical protein
MRKLFLILTIVCLFVTLTVLNAVPVSADVPEDGDGPRLTITPPKPIKINDPTFLQIEVSLPGIIVEVADEELSKADEVNPDFIDYYSETSHT